MSTQEIVLHDAEFVLIQKLVFKHVGITLDDTKKKFGQK